MRARTVRRGVEGNSVSRWLPPGLATGVSAPTHGEAPAPEFERGYEEGFAKGCEDGLRAATEQMQQQLQLLSQLAGNAMRPFEALDERVEDELCRLSLCIARQVVRRELHSDPDQVAALVRESRKLLGAVEGELCIGVHPDDAALVRRMFPEDQELSRVQVEEDPSLSRGGCTLSTDHSFVDATVETRIARLAVQLLGDERGMDASPERGEDRA